MVTTLKTTDGKTICKTHGYFPETPGATIFLEDGHVDIYRVVEAIPLYTVHDNLVGGESGQPYAVSKDKYIFLDKVDKQIESGAPGFKPDGEKYIVAKADGTPVKDGAEYLILNIVHDRAAQQAAKVYCDAQTDSRYANFVNTLRGRLQEIRSTKSKLCL